MPGHVCSLERDAMHTSARTAGALGAPTRAWGADTTDTSASTTTGSDPDSTGQDDVDTGATDGSTSTGSHGTGTSDGASGAETTSGTTLAEEPPLGFCSYDCRDEECERRFPGTECTSTAGYCLAVECGRTIDCASSVQYCDVSANACFDRAGRCDDRSECPVYPDFSWDERIDCVDGWCRWVAGSITTAGLSPRQDEPIHVLEPESGHVFASSDDFEVRWNASQAAIAVVTDAPPTRADLLTSAMVWFAAVPAGRTSVRWSDGRDGAGRRPPAPLPTDRTLYVTVFTVELGALQAVSAAVPFGVGDPAPFKSTGDACEPVEGDLLAPCPNPYVPLGCRFGACRQLCVSQVECDSGTTCGLEHRPTGLRFCE